MTTATDHLLEMRWSKLAALDAKVSRCRICGEWMWRGQCKFDHELITNYRRDYA